MLYYTLFKQVVMYNGCWKFCIVALSQTSCISICDTVITNDDYTYKLLCVNILCIILYIYILTRGWYLLDSSN